MKKLVIVIIAAVLICGGAIAAGIAIYNSPKQVAARALKGVVEDLAEREEIAPLNKILNGGSVELRADSEELNDLLELEKELAFEGKLYFGKKSVYLDKATLLYGDQILRGSAYLSEDTFYVKNPEILDGTWGLDRGRLEAEWKKSAFVPTSGTRFALEQAEFDAVTEIMKALDDHLDEDMAADLEKVADRYAKKAWKLVAKHAEFESDTEGVRINKERRDARTITITLDDKALAAILEDLYDYLADDDKLANLVVEYGDRFASTLKENYQIEDAAEAYDRYLVDLEEELDQTIERIEEYMDDELVITIVTPPSSAELLMLGVEYDGTDYLKVQIGHDGLKETDCISVNVMKYLEVVYRITEDSKTACKAELELNGRTLASFDLDRKNGDYKLVISDFWSFEGTWKVKGGKYTITLDRMDNMRLGRFDSYKNLGITLTLNEKDKMPRADESVSSIFSADEATLRRWKERLEAYDIFSINGSH
jgi:hypothetical protein